MSTSWYGTLDVPTTLDPDDAIAIVTEGLSNTAWNLQAELGTFHHVSIDDGIYVDLPNDALPFHDELRVVEGRLVASLWMSNLEREIGDVIDEEKGYAVDTGLYDSRHRMDVLFEALTRICDAPVGTLIGSLMCENDEGDASPLVVTPDGVRMIRSNGDYHRSNSYGFPIEEFPDQSSVPPDLLAPDDAWRWKVDVVALKERLRGVVLDAPRNGVLTRLT